MKDMIHPVNKWLFGCQEKNVAIGNIENFHAYLFLTGHNGKKQTTCINYTQ